MIKLCMCVKRLPEISRDEFLDYWSNHHAKLVTELREDLGIARYTQTVLLPDAAMQQGLAKSRGTLLYPFDGLGEVWWHSLEQMRQARSTPAAQAASRRLFEDECRFVNHAESYLWLAREEVIF